MVVYADVGGPNLVKIICILDTGASHTSVDLDFVTKHGLPTGPELGKTITYLDRQVTLKFRQCDLQLVSQDQSYRCMVIAEAVEGFSRNCQLWPWSKFICRHKHLKDLSIPEYPDPPTGIMLIGVDHPELLEVLEYRRSAEMERCIGTRTRLGWGFFGPDPLALGNKAYSTREGDEYLARLIQRQFDLENLGALERVEHFEGKDKKGPRDPACWTEAERQAEAAMTVKLLAEGGYEAGIPWVPGHDQRLQGNFVAVKGRQARSHSARSLARRGVTLDELDKIFAHYREMSYVEEVPTCSQGGGWYLPYFEVVNRTKSTPVRVVFDAKASYQGVSLNNQIQETPNRLNDLFLVLLRMRRFRYFLSGDIKEMFLQIRLKVEDRQFHRFVFGDKHYQWCRVLFGNKSSPNISQKVLVTLCHDNPQYGEAIKTVLESCYMDDCIDSRPLESDIIQLARELPPLLRSGGMKICKIFSNSREALEVTPPELRHTGVDLGAQDELWDSHKVLGMVYDPNQDMFGFQARYQTALEWQDSIGGTWTKREVLRVTASHYDPLGLASPLTIGPRRFFQKLWTQELGWDTPLSKDLVEAWLEVLEHLVGMTGLHFPRWSGDGVDSQAELHVFCDASSEVYACSVYLRTYMGGGGWESRLLTAKARVTSLNTPSVSRSELDACVLGVRMTAHLREVFPQTAIQAFYYTDSKNVLFWVSNTPKALKVFVQRRVAEIHQVSRVAQWAHVGTADNPADIPTRPVDPGDLCHNTLWFEGPSFLREKEYAFKPFKAGTEHPPDGYAEEVKEICLLNLVESPGVLDPLLVRSSVGRFNDGWLRLLRILRYVLVLANPSSGLETLSAKAELVLLSYLQKKSFVEDMTLLSLGKQLDRDGPLFAYQPYLDSGGVMRSHTRLAGSSLPYEVTDPILLDSRQAGVRLMVESFHHRFKHPVGSGLLRAELNKRFLILGLGRLLRRISRACTECTRARVRFSPPLMGPLPRDILEGGKTARAFEVTGLDFAGPFHLKGAGRGLRAPIRHVLVLTCMRTRAVHFEVCNDQTSHAVALALIRFTCLYGNPKILYSDNQSSFLKLRQELRVWVDSLDIALINQEIHRDCGLVWKTSPARGPHFGGRWESMVKAMKRALYSIGNARYLKEDEFRTFLCRSASLLNSRPLIPVSGDDEFEALTPNHFLNRTGSGGLELGPHGPEGLGAAFRYWTASLEQLWIRFQAEVLAEYRKPSKWLKESRPLRVGDLVIMLEDGVQRPLWPLGRILEVVLGRDGVIRSAMVKTPTGVVSRPALRLVPLLEAESDSCKSEAPGHVRPQGLEADKVEPSSDFVPNQRA